MYRIYFNDRLLHILAQTGSSRYDANTVVFYSDGSESLQQLPGRFDESGKIRIMAVPVPEEKQDEAFRQICSGYDKQINAGGGLIVNQEGKYLLILRNGLWDLPKGKQEPGEPIGQTALREVEEECGLSGMKQERLLCITRHCYRQNDAFILKHTHWYLMRYEGTEQPVPQEEENICRAVWVEAEKLPEYLDNTYPSIREVFENAGLPIR